MPVSNWPPATAPSWPPVELGLDHYECSDVRALIEFLLENNFTRANPTVQENNHYFKNVRCDESHPCSGIIIVSPLGVRYPFAYCTGATHKQLLTLWLPDYCMGAGSAQE